MKRERYHWRTCTSVLSLNIARTKKYYAHIAPFVLDSGQACSAPAKSLCGKHNSPLRLSNSFKIVLASRIEKTPATTCHTVRVPLWRGPGWWSRVIVGRDLSVWFLDSPCSARAWQ